MSLNAPRFLRILIGLISCVVLLGAVDLSIKEWFLKGSCPSISGIPLCYVVTISYFMVFISIFFKTPVARRGLFISGSVILFGLAVTGSLLQAQGVSECPKTGDGFPMCYISLGVISLLVVLFIVKERKELRAA